MLREPYNLNPYNTTIDTSLVQPFSFVFSGDKLGAYQIQVAENNSADNIFYTSPLIIPNTPIYNGDRVEFTLPNTIQTNVNANDGRLYYVYKLELTAADKTWVESSAYDADGMIKLTYATDDMEGVYITTPFTETTFFAPVLNQGTPSYMLILTNSGYGLSVNAKCDFYNKSGVYIYSFNSGMGNELTFEQYQIRINNTNTPFGIPDPTDFTNYRIQFHGMNFTITGQSIVRPYTPGATNLYLNLSSTLDPTETYIVDSDNIITYYLYTVTEIALLQNLVGRDLVWRIIQWEELIWNEGVLSGAKIQNYVRNGQIIAKMGDNSIFSDLKISTEIGVLTPVIENYQYANLENKIGYIFYSPNPDRNPPQPYTSSSELGYGDYRLRVEIPVIDVSDDTVWDVMEDQIGEDIVDVTDTRAWAQLTSTITKRSIDGKMRWCFMITPDMEPPFAITNIQYSQGRGWFKEEIVDNVPTKKSTIAFCSIDGQYFGTTYWEEGTDKFFVLLTYNEFAVDLVENATYTIDVFSNRSNKGIIDWVDETDHDKGTKVYSHTVRFTLYGSYGAIPLYMSDGSETELDTYWQLKGFVEDMLVDIPQNLETADITNSFNERGFWTTKTENVTSYSIISQPIGSYFSYNVYQTSRHCIINETAQCKAVLAGALWYLYIPVAHTLTNLVTYKNYFEFAIVDNIYFSPDNITLFTDTDGTKYYKLSLTPFYGNSDQRYLINNEYYGYELIMKINTKINEFDDTVTYTYYNLNTSLNIDGPHPTFDLISYTQGIQIRHTLIERQYTHKEGNPPVEVVETYCAYVYAQYSTGNVRGYIDGPIDESFKISSIYQLYSNFDKSNWTYFESRETPHVIPQYINFKKENAGYVEEIAPLPGVNFIKRAITVTASYYQANMIPLRYYQWIFYDSSNNILDDSGPIYDGSFEYTLSPITKNDTYRIKLITVSQNNVTVEKDTSISTSLKDDYIINTSPEVNRNEHYVSLTWNGDLSAVPAKYSIYDNNNFGKRIGVTNQQKDFALINDEDILGYNEISGRAYDLSQDEFVYRMGFVIEDDLEEYTELGLIQFIFGDTNVALEKNGYPISLNEASTILLNPTHGPNEIINSNIHRGQLLSWFEEEDETSILWQENNYYWVETTSNTSEYYYELIISKQLNHEVTVQLYRTPFMRGSYTGEDVTNSSVQIPYNNLLLTSSNGSNSIKGRLDVNNGVEATYTLTRIVEQNQVNYNTMLLSQVPKYDTEYVIYGTEETIWDNLQISWPTDDTLQSFNFNPKLYLYYVQISQKYVNTIDDSLGFGEKPSWDDWNDTPTAPFMILTFNNTLQSHRVISGESTISQYEIYRIKYPSEQEAEEDENRIYTMFIGKVNAAESEDLASAAQMRFYDYTIENNGWYRYQIIPTGSYNDTYTVTTPFKTDWYGWSFTSFEPEGDHYVPIDTWIYVLNLESKGYSHITNKVFHQGFNRYPKVSIGITDYITSDMTALIGKFKQTLSNGLTNNSYYDDNIEQIYAWEEFTNNGHYILVKDYKGRAYIAQLDSNAMRFQDVVKEILTTVSFNITQIDDVSNYAIFKVKGVH